MNKLTKADIMREGKERNREKKKKLEFLKSLTFEEWVRRYKPHHKIVSDARKIFMDFQKDNSAGSPRITRACAVWFAYNFNGIVFSQEKAGRIFNTYPNSMRSRIRKMIDNDYELYRRYVVLKSMREFNG